MDKLFPVNPRAITGPPKMSLLLEAKSCQHWSSNQGLSLLRTRMTLVETKRPTSSIKCLFETTTGLSADQMLWQGRSCIAPQTVFQLTWCLRKTFLLIHKIGTRNNFRQRGVIWVTNVCYYKNPFNVRNISHRVKCSTTSMDQADNQLISTRHSCKVKG